MESFAPYFTEECTTGGEHPAVLLLLCTADTSDLINGLLGVLPDTAEGRDAAEPLPTWKIPSVSVSHFISDIANTELLSCTYPAVDFTNHSLSGIFFL